MLYARWIACLHSLLLIMNYCSGQAPFDGKDDYERLDAVRRGTFTFPEDAKLSAHAVGFVAGCLFLDPEKRLTAAGVRLLSAYKICFVTLLLLFLEHCFSQSVLASRRHSNTLGLRVW